MLTIEGDYPVAITPYTEDEPGSEAAGQAMQNGQLLRVLNLLELTAHGATPENSLDADLARVEAKLDILLTMLGEWLVAQRPLPPSRHVWFSLDKIALALPAPLPRGQRVLVELYTSATVPRPLRFSGIVGRIAEAPERTIVDIAIERPRGAVADDLERYVFLLHRRQLSNKVAP